MNYEEGLKLGLSKYEIEDLPNMSNQMLALIIEGNPGCVPFIESVLEQSGKTLDIDGLVDELVDEIDNIYFDPDYGYEDPESKKRALRELGYDYDEIKEAEREKTPLQKRELELSQQEREEKTISEEEKLFEQKENEGQSK